MYVDDEGEDDKECFEGGFGLCDDFNFLLRTESCRPDATSSYNI